MNDKQNVTLSLPKDLLRKAKITAIEHETSLSGLMVDLLSQFLEQREQYAVAKQKHLALLADDYELGTKGNIHWQRDALHERETDPPVH